MEDRLSAAFIIGEKVFLRSPKDGDEEIFSIIENHPDPRETLFYSTPISINQQRNKITKLINNHNTIIFTICKKTNQIPIGQVALLRIDWVGRMATFYLGIAEKSNWSGGYGTETVKLILNYAFNELNFNRIQLHVAEKNHAAIRIYEKNGFVVEGKLREAMFQHGKYHNFLLMAILHKEWQTYNKKVLTKNYK